MGNSQNPKKQIIKNDMQPQPTQQISKNQEKPIKQKQKEENDLEAEFLKFLAIGDRKNKWKTYFKINKITSMADLLSSYQMSETTRTGRRLNEAEKQILNNYLLRQSKEEDIIINYKSIHDLKFLKYIESFDQFKEISLTNMKIRNILIVGITGQGKSTFINSFVTAIEREFKPRVKGKELNLDYFVIIKVKDHQAQSDTNEVTSYKFIIDNHLIINLIDTPGLADTEGLQKDQERITQISKYIEDQIYKKNQNLHAILFVSQSSTQYEVIDGNPSLLQLSMLSILKLFGKEMCAFTKHCLTFSDFTATSTQNFESRDSIFYSVKEQQILINSRKPDQQEHLQETFNEAQFKAINQPFNTEAENNEAENKIQEEFYFQFQNSVFRAIKHGFIENIHFQKNLGNYQKLFDFIKNEANDGFKLVATVQVIQQRTQIRTELGGLQHTLLQLIKVLKSVDENTRKLQIYRNKIEDSKMFESVIFLIEWKKEFIFKNKKKAFSTNCNKCNKTCCKACDSKILDHCIEMIEKNVKGVKQIICSRCNHEIEFHTQQEYFWKPEEVQKIIIDESLKQENDNAQKNSSKIKQLLEEQEITRNNTKENIKDVMIKMKECLQGLLSSALYRLDILDVEAYDFVLKFYPDYRKALEEFEDMDDLKVTTQIREKIKKDKLMASKTLLSVETQQFNLKQFKRN
ncbi:unnamed protein product (macronuclear) [Paramecium tetraurelia]|uniref:G domain-containing protein n=1 Tax=Paramecium tetraurelia TaxID=5888 RepID=A0CB32_PARTE|nr:uncharacterized protein GSPATT00036782001 [Paramecium tetraurelia]CAK67999.1 unnamed protein product [Paramecium tetraurelia]|eukprot:XP_001435396.1 hypothetical protein (macronuclear) [Paramecium tetraurelia strain d4-2]